MFHIPGSEVHAERTAIGKFEIGKLFVFSVANFRLIFRCLENARAADKNVCIVVKGRCLHENGNNATSGMNFAYDFSLSLSVIDKSTARLFDGELCALSIQGKGGHQR